MGYDYYEQRRREEERERITYRSKRGFIIPVENAQMAYALGEMDGESVTKYDLNHPANPTIKFMEKFEEINKSYFNRPTSSNLMKKSDEREPIMLSKPKLSSQDSEEPIWKKNETNPIIDFRPKLFSRED